MLLIHKSTDFKKKHIILDINLNYLTYNFIKYILLHNKWYNFIVTVRKHIENQRFVKQRNI